MLHFHPHQSITSLFYFRLSKNKGRQCGFKKILRSVRDINKNVVQSHKHPHTSIHSQPVLGAVEDRDS